MIDAAKNEIYIGDEVWFTDEGSPTFYKGKIVSLNEDLGEVTIEVDAKGNTKGICTKRFWSVLKPITESKELYESFKKEKQIIDKKLNKIKKMYSYIESKNNTYNKIQNKLLSKNNTFSFNTKNQFIKKIALKKSLKYYKKIKQYKNNINFIFSYIFLICGVEVVTNINKMKNFNKNNNSNLFNILKFKYSVPFNDQNELLNKYELKNLDKYFKSYKIIQTMNDCVGFTLNCNTIICAINNNIKNGIHAIMSISTQLSPNAKNKKNNTIIHHAPPPNVPSHPPNILLNLFPIKNPLLKYIYKSNKT